MKTSEIEQQGDALPDDISITTGAVYSTDLLLQVVSACVTQVLHAKSVIKVLPETLRAIAKIVHIDRIVIVELQHGADGTEESTPYFVWTAEDAPRVDTREIILNNPAGRDALHAWAQPLRQGKTIIGIRRLMDEPVRDLMLKLEVISVLEVPIMINGEYWGHIVFDDCKSEREWTAAQINVLKLFAELLGTAVTRQRSNEEIRQRDILLSAITASAMEIMTAPNLHEAIANSLEAVAKAVRVDRMFILEIVPATHTRPSQRLLRYAWQSPDLTTGLGTLSHTLSGPTAPDMIRWVAPLHEGRVVKGRLSYVSAGVQEFFKKFGVLSKLIVPIVVDGKRWGGISFDDCKRERDWSHMEIDILTMLAELIGTAITRDRHVEELAKTNTIVQNSSTILSRLRGESSFPLIYISKNIALLGHSAEEMMESPTRYRDYVHPDDRGKVQSMLMELLKKNAAPVTIEYRMLTSSGGIRWMESRYTPVRDNNGRLSEVEGIMIDITERKQAGESIALLAHTDGLTGLANRAAFNDHLRQAFAAALDGGNPFAILYLDLDHFREVNDSRGHPVGDKLLQAVALRLKAAAGGSDLVARLGGDEFAVLQASVANTAVAGSMADQILSAISAPYDIDGTVVHIGTSIGIAVFSVDAASPDTLLVQAYQALYRAKEEGRGQYRFH